MTSLRLHYGFKVFKEHRWAFLVAAALMLLETLVSLAIPYFVGKQSELFLQDNSVFGEQHYRILGAWIGLFALQGVFRFWSSYKVNVLGAQIMAKLSCRLYDHIQLLPIQYFKNTKRGDVLSMLSNDLAIVSFFASSVFTNLLPNLLVLIGAVILMYFIDPFVTLAICILAPAVYIVIKLIGRNMHPISKALVQRQADSIALASENIGAISLIKAFNRESSESIKFKQHNDDILDLRSQQFRLQSMLSPLVQFLSSVAILLVIVICLLKFQSGGLTVSDLISLLLYGFIFTRPLSSLASLYGQIQQTVGASSRLLTIYHVDGESVEDTGAHINITNGDIQFEGVSFGYLENKLVLSNLSFVLPAKSSMLIWGKNGGGKTTLLHLLMRFYEPSSGQILIDGQNIQEVNSSSLRSQIGFVSQDVMLVNGTIYDNIIYGIANPSQKHIIESAKQAGIHELVKSLPLGYETQVGEGGLKLSGGQRQRIALARVLLLKPKILLLDEPTSMLDGVARKTFKEEFASLFSRYTVIIISHDPSLDDVAEYAFELNSGNLIAR